jgi:predicted dehydrogenase
MGNQIEHSGKVRVGVIGAGWWATSAYLPLLTADSRVEVVAVNRLGVAELERVKREFKIGAAFEDYREMLSSVELDALLVTSPHTLHFEHASAALRQGAHVLVEKPMTTAAVDARKLVALAQQAQRHLLVAYGWNFTALAREGRRLVQQGAIGDIEHVSLHMASATGDLFSGEGLAEARDQMFQPASSTWADPRNAGGYGWGQLTHALGLLFQITELAPAEVLAITRASRAGVDAYDAGVIRFTNGAIGAISGAATVPKSCGFQLDLRLFGTQGMLLLDIERVRLEVRRHDRADTIAVLASAAAAYSPAAVIDAFIRLCAGQTPENHSSGLVGQRSVETLDALYRSAASGRFERVQADDLGTI